jgi:hypothetical protein
MAQVMNSLFGMTPESLMADREATLQAQAMQYAQADPFQRASANLYRGGNQLGGAIGGMLGAQDPQLQKATALQSILQQADTTTPEGLAALAQTLNQQGFGQQAMQVMDRARQAVTQTGQAQLQAAQISKVQAEEAKLTQASQREEQLRTALAALPLEAADKDVEAVVRQFGNPDRIFSTLEKRQTAEANRIAKAELEREKAETRERERQRDMEFKQQLAVATQANKSALTGVQREIAQTRLDELKAKQADKTEKKEEAKQAAVNHASKVISDVQTAEGFVTGMTTGLIGKGTSFVPGTTAYNLQQQLLTLKANLGFDRLQQMRDASPTGGALGQVAVQELQALQATVGSLELGQSKAELQKNLNKIENHYSNWIRTTQGEQPLTLEQFLQTKQPQVTAPAGAATGGWSIRPR